MLFRERYDPLAGRIINIKEKHKKSKKGVDKWDGAWYSNQAVGAAVPRRGLKSKKFEEIQKSA